MVGPMHRLALVLLALAVSPRPAEACSTVGAGSFEVDPASDDAVPPGPPGALASTRVNRGVGPECFEDGSRSYTSCDDLGSITLYFPPALDDRAPAPDPAIDRVQQGVGYTVRLVEGTPPDRLTFSEDALLNAFVDADADGGVHLQFAWIDESTEEQEAFELTLGVTAVDLAGNRSAEVYFDVADPGREDSDGVEGCPEPEAASCATSPVAGVWALFAAAALVARRRHR